jgi:uncharacterized protein (DUF2252 family)
MKKPTKIKQVKNSKQIAAIPEEAATTPDPDFSKLPIDAAYLKKDVHRRTRTDRFEAGRALRAVCPREAHAEFEVSRARRKDPIKLLIASSEGRIEELLPIRYGRMLASPFAFFRGASIIMAADLSKTPASGYAVQACGDCHLMNFGAFATPERNIVFDINDFDETFPAPWEWDLKRLAASFVIAGRHNGHNAKSSKATVMALVGAYRDRLSQLAEMPALAAWYAALDYKELIDLTVDTQLKRKQKKALQNALARDSLHEFVRLGHVVDQTPKIKDNPPLIYHHESQKSPEYEEQVRHAMALYRESLSPERRVLLDRYELVDTAIKVVGVGSVGTYCTIGLFFAAENDPLFLQLKEARKSVLEPYVDFDPFPSNGERVVFGQRLMQTASDIFLGHTIADSGRHCYIRQLRDVKVKPMVEIFNPANMLSYAGNCGWALADAHARSGDAAIIAGYIGKGEQFASAIYEFSVRYAEQNDADYAALKDAVQSGLVIAKTE